jgi:hypothetical protein
MECLVRTLWRRRFAIASFAISFLWPSIGSAAPLMIALRGAAPLPAMAADQHGATFTVSGLSGMTHLGGSLFAAVMDNSNKLVQLEVLLADDGAISSATFTAGTTLADMRDFEGIAYAGARRGAVWLADEGDPQLREYDLQTGALRQSIAAPGVFSQRRDGLGWESLARRSGGAELWTANEEALSVDGGVSSPSQGTVVRLVRHIAIGDSFAPLEQFAYSVEPWHAGDSGATTAERSGLVDLVTLGDGTILALERSLAFSGPVPSFQNRIYQLDFAGATNIAALPGLAAGQSYVPVIKQLLWSGAAAGPLGMNMEGLALGPRLANGHATLIGIVDDGGASDPLSANAVVAFEITSSLNPPSTAGDLNFDGAVDGADLARLVETYGSTSGALWEDGDFDGDGRVELADLRSLQSNFVPASAAASPHAPAVPEPATNVIFALALILVFYCYVYWPLPLAARPTPRRLKCHDQ